MKCDQNINQMYCANDCQIQPIVMPTQVLTKQRICFMEQPIICPVECRTINRVVLVPRYYRAWSQTCVNNCNCLNQQ